MIFYKKIEATTHGIHEKGEGVKHVDKMQSLFCAVTGTRAEVVVVVMPRHAVGQTTTTVVEVTMAKVQDVANKGRAELTFLVSTQYCYFVLEVVHPN